MKSRFSIMTIVIIALMLAVFTLGKEKDMSDERPQPKSADNDNPVVRLETDFGNIDIQLFEEVAPEHAKNFVKLTKEGFFDSLTFHRIIPGFVIQGGDPKGDGTGGPGYTLPAEFSDLKHTPGMVAAARRGDGVNPEKRSSGSQFYIVLAPTPHLDGQYTIFGEVVDGMDAVNKIAEVPLKNPRMGNPKENVYINKAEVVK